MSRLNRQTVEEKYREINEEYNRFSYEITQYGLNGKSKVNIKESAMRLRLLLKKFL